jgi:F-type H+-transporting ATPase subunit delta
VTSRTAAIRYARALLDVALKERLDPRAVETELAGFLDLLRQHPTLESVLLNPVVPVPRKRAAMAELVKLTDVSPVVAKLLVLLAERDRLGLLTDLLAAYRERLMDHLKVVRAELTTSTPLDSTSEARIQESLARATGRTVTMTTRVDPALIGGMVARLGGTIYDASVATQLQKMKERLTERRG